MNIKMGEICFRATCFLALVVILGCDMRIDKYSDDIGKFQSVIKTDLSFKTIRWEIFNTPEYTGGVPGPTDYVTLVAEVAPIDPQYFQSRPKTGEVWVAPESARPWLDSGFHELLEKYKNKSVDVSIMPNCRKFEGKLKQSDRAVNGFICNRLSKSLIYLTLSDNAAP